MFWMLHHICEKELGRLFEYGIQKLPKKLNIWIKAKVFPNLKCYPNTGCNEDPPTQPPAGTSKAPGICDHMADPARRSVHRLRRLPAGLTQLLYQNK